MSQTAITPGDTALASAPLRDAFDALALRHGPHDKRAVSRAAGTFATFIRGYANREALLLQALETVAEYWNGAAESAVDAAEEMGATARAAIEAHEAAVKAERAAS